MPSRRERANAIRALSMDAVQKANSGHPGAPMGMADIAEVLWRDYLKHNPSNPSFADRDRFVLSNGHGSMLIYSLLHLTGYDVTIDDLKSFRQLHSRTPGHPEFGYTPGVETTTGPLGQGLANAVGFALAEKVLGAQFNREGHNVVDHNTYVFLGDGCMMEGISHEVASLAGTLGLNKLVAFYDDNGISIDGEVEGWFTDDTPKRFESYNWLVIRNVNGHDADEIRTAIDTARKSDRPTLICCKTIIGFGSPNKQGKEDCHGAPLGNDEIALARKELNWNHGPFEVPADIYAEWDAKDAGAKVEAEWNKRFDAYAAAFPELAGELKRRLSGELPADFAEKAAAYIAEVAAKGETIASRKASQNTLNAFGPLLPELLGGSADLAGSNLTLWKGCKGVSHEDANGNYMYYGVREFGMTAIMNGVALHGGLVPYGATFLMFMEYARKASQNTLNAFGPLLPELLGGSADLAGSNLTLWKGCKGVSHEDANGNYMYYGVREFGMTAIMNGVALHGGLVPYGATFLMFMEYARNAVRMSALMKQRVIHVYTHDSIGLGEDGPTHQPIEQLASLRSTPNLDTWRPADAVESAVSWKHALERKDGPSALIFSRQNLQHQDRDAQQIADIARGGYVLKDCAGEPELILIATGSEVGLAVQAFDKLTEQGRKVRVVSMPSTSVFDAQDAAYKQSVLPLEVGARIAIEAAHADFWYKYVGLEGRIIGMTTYGESAPASALFEEFGFTLENILGTAEELLED